MLTNWQRGEARHHVLLPLAVHVGRVAALCSALCTILIAVVVIVHHILPLYLQSTPLPDLDDAIAQWFHGHDSSLRLSATADVLLENVPDACSHACLLAFSAIEFGASQIHFWASVWTMTPGIRVAIGLCLDSPFCKPHVH